MVIVYLVAIVLANLSVAWFGKWASIVNALLFIGLDLVARDRLHETWHGRGLVWKMGLLIATGSLLSWLLNRNTGMIAVASFVAFTLAAVTDTLVYAFAVRRGWTWLQKSNGSNVASAAVDSLVFPWIAFGGFQPVVTALQFLAKVLGGAAWAWVLRGRQPNSG
jgi:queuosine precursor transporter